MLEHAVEYRPDLVFENFYRTPRAGAEFLSDGGGPFGFDIHAALQVEYVISRYGIGSIFETGCCMADTTDYLARRYSALPIWTCDVDMRFASFAQTRLAKYPQVSVECGDSVDLLPAALSTAEMPFIYLDAHWLDEWPLAEELKIIERGLVVIDDFNIEHPRFGYDTYDGVECDVDLVANVLQGVESVFFCNPDAQYPFPCLQVGRRAGRCFIPIGISAQPMQECDFFREVSISSAAKAVS